MREQGSIVNISNLLSKISQKAGSVHDRVPFIRKLPKQCVGIILLLVVINIIVWIAAGVILHYNRALASTCVLSWVLGLRHALDADHISAIDLMTRRLVASGEKPVTVGTWFSLGHSTIVIITSMVVAATANAISSKFDAFTKTGNIIGASISSAFLLILGLMNIYILYSLTKELRRRLSEPLPAPTNGNEQDPQHQQEPLELPDWQQPKYHGSCIFLLLRHLFKLVNRPWKMYPIGILFGLGFDTSSEIALLGIASLSASHHTTSSVWLILIFPALFTAGMCLLDTVDGALMMALYSATSERRDVVMVLYYSVVLTGVTVLVALGIGTLQVLGLVGSVVGARGGFWEGMERVGEHYDVIGGAICGSFVVFGVLSMLLYKPWRRWADRRRPFAVDDNEALKVQESVDVEIRMLEDVKKRPNESVCQVIGDLEGGYS